MPGRRMDDGDLEPQSDVIDVVVARGICTMVMKATFDAAVVTEWARRREHFQRKGRWLWWVFAVLLVLAVVPALLGMIAPFPWLVVVAVCAIAYAVTLRSRYLAVIACPHCDKKPWSLRTRRLALVGHDLCPHCYYWLIDPRRGKKP